MINSLADINPPIISDIYAGSLIQVICGDQLTEPIKLRTGIKPGVLGAQ